MQNFTTSGEHIQLMIPNKHADFYGDWTIAGTKTVKKL